MPPTSSGSRRRRERPTRARVQEDAEGPGTLRGELVPGEAQREVASSGSFSIATAIVVEVLDPGVPGAAVGLDDQPPCIDERVHTLPTRLASRERRLEPRRRDPRIDEKAFEMALELTRSWWLAGSEALKHRLQGPEVTPAARREGAISIAHRVE